MTPLETPPSMSTPLPPRTGLGVHLRRPEGWTSAGRIVRPWRTSLRCSLEGTVWTWKEGLGRVRTSSSGLNTHQLLDLGHSETGPSGRVGNTALQRNPGKGLLTGARWKSQKCSGQVHRWLLTHSKRDPDPSDPCHSNRLWGLNAPQCPQRLVI